MMTSRTSTDIPAMLDMEKNLFTLATGTLLPAFMEELGYDVDTTQIDVEETSEWQSFERRADEINERLNTGNLTPDQKNQLGTELYKIRQDQERYREEYVPEIDFKTTKKEPTLELQRAKDEYEQYDEGSTEYQEAKARYEDVKTQYEEKQISSEKKQQEIHDLFMEKSLDFLNGKMSITDEQKAEIANTLKPIREAVEKMETTSLKAADEYIDSVKDTSMPLGAALAAVGEQIRATGEDVETAFKGTMKTNRELLKMGIEDRTGEITKKMNAQAAVMGLSSMDPKFQNEMMENVAREIQRGDLNLAAMESQGMISIKAETGAKLESLAMKEAGMIEGATREKKSIKQAKAQADIGIEEQAANMRWGLGTGMPQQQIAIGSGIYSFNEALAQERLRSAQGAIGVPLGVGGYLQGDRRAQPTQTTQAPLWPSLVGMGMGAVSAGANIYGAAQMRGASAGMSGAMSGGGGFFGGRFPAF